MSAEPIKYILIPTHYSPNCLKIKITGKNEKLRDLEVENITWCWKSWCLDSFWTEVWLCVCKTRGAGFIPSGLRKSAPVAGWKIWIRDGGGDRNVRKGWGLGWKEADLHNVCVCSVVRQGGEFLDNLLSCDCLWRKTKNLSTH